MSATETPVQEVDNNDQSIEKSPVEKIEQYLSDEIENGRGYYKSKEIAEAIDMKTRKVATYMTDINEYSTRISIEKWAYTNSTTWLAKRVNS